MLRCDEIALASAGNVGCGKSAVAESFGCEMSETLDLPVYLYRLKVERTRERERARGHGQRSSAMPSPTSSSQCPYSLGRGGSGEEPQGEKAHHPPGVDPFSWTRVAEISCHGLWVGVILLELDRRMHAEGAAASLAVAEDLRCSKIALASWTRFSIGAG